MCLFASRQHGDGPLPLVLYLCQAILFAMPIVVGVGVNTASTAVSAFVAPVLAGGIVCLLALILHLASHACRTWDLDRRGGVNVDDEEEELDFDFAERADLCAFVLPSRAPHAEYFHTSVWRTHQLILFLGALILALLVLQYSRRETRFSLLSNT
jgi:hypothetical protein